LNGERIEGAVFVEYAVIGFALKVPFDLKVTFKAKPCCGVLWCIVVKKVLVSRMVQGNKSSAYTEKTL